MSTGTVEVIFLEGIDLGGSPPCEMMPDATGNRSCGRPSVARVRGTCPNGHDGMCFVCERCLKDFNDPGQRIECMQCHSNITGRRSA